MKILRGEYNGKVYTTGRVLSGFTGGVIIRLRGRWCRSKLRVPGDLTGLAVINREERWSIGVLFLVVLLAITVIGLVLALPLLFVAKHQETLFRITTPSGTFDALADRAEWRKLSRYIC